uniref:Uncharacterized protein n=1 Tax=Rhizophora mucronata TaxID=61149 RepID=A0A2P2N8W3_RHIMU
MLIKVHFYLPFWTLAVNFSHENCDQLNLNVYCIGF